MSTTLITGGTVVSATGRAPADVLVDGEKIVAVLAPGSELLGTNLAASVDTVVDASAKYVIPGGIDAHTHMQLPFGGTFASDTFETGTRAAAWGGTTTIVDFAVQTYGTKVPDGLAKWHELAAGNCAIDYGFHQIVGGIDDESLAFLPTLVDEGITSYKLFMAYPGVFYSDDAQILKAMQVAADTGLLTMMHAENGPVIDVLAQQLVDAGFEILFECTAPTCGGFDFRFNTRVMAAPDMFVDLLDFRFLSARRNGQDNGADYVTLLVSRANDSGYVQIIQAGGEQIEVADTPTAPAAGSGSAPPVAPGAAPLSDQPLAQALLDRGHVILSDLDFETGSSALGAGPFASLRALADFLNADSARRVALVGHTDTVGGLEPNIALSRERAASVLSRLAEDYQVPRAQMDAEGAGYLAPIASNRSDHGRESNRRVEVVLLRSE